MNAGSRWATATRFPAVPVRLVAAVFACAVLAGLIATSYRWSVRDDRGLLDFGSFFASGQAANAGDDPYGVYELTYRFGSDGVPAPNLNPPISIYPFQVLAQFDAETSSAAWYVVSLGCFAAAVVVLFRAFPNQGAVAFMAAFGLAGLWHTLELGQIYTPLVLAAAGAMAWLLPGDTRRAGVLLGLIAAIKPQFGLALLLLLLAGHRKSAATGIGTAMALYAIPLALEGPGIYEAWLGATPPLLPANTLPGNSSLLAIFGRFDLAPAGLVLSVMVVATTAVLVWKRRPAAIDVALLGLTTAVVVGPISWPGYTLLLLPVFAVRGWGWNLPALLLLLFPYWLVIDLTAGDGAAAAVIGSLYGLASLILWWSLVVPLLPARGSFALRAAETVAAPD